MNFGSKLNRVRLQADRLFLRADKTDVIGELREAEEQADELKILCEAFHRSLEKRLTTHSVIEEKKHKKVPENQVAETLKDALKEASQNLSEDFPEKHLFRTIIEEVVAVEQLLGRVILDHEEQIETEVLAPLHKLLREDFPTLAKQKKSLKQAGQDLDAAKARFRNSQTNVSQTTKLESYREEQDDAESKFEQIRDAYACDLFCLLGKQREVSRLFILYLEIKLDHLQKSLTQLNKVLPPIRKTFENSSCSPIYGVPLHEHLRFTEQEIALPIQICVKHMIEFGIREEGLLRMAGSNTKIRRLKALFDAGFMTSETLSFNEYNRDYDIHVIAGAFKGYLRELPEPLMTHVKHDELIEAIRKPDHDEKLRSLWQVINALPQQNYANLKYVMKFLSMLASYSSENKMTPNNIAIVMAPNLIGSQKSEDTEIIALGRNMTLGNDYRTMIEQLIEYCDYFFKGDFDFGVQPKPPPSPKLNSSVNGTGSQGHHSVSQFTRTGSHRRTGSSEFNTVTGTSPNYPECESPKQPHRMKKKPAPLPPPSDCIEPSMCSSPEPRRSKTPPSSSMSSSMTSIFAQPNVMSTSIGPSPAPRLQHTNSIKRPTAEPPKPPATSQPPVKPPRPSPPQLSIESQPEKPPRPNPPIYTDNSIEAQVTSDNSFTEIKSSRENAAIESDKSNDSKVQSENAVSNSRVPKDNSDLKLPNDTSTIKPKVVRDSSFCKSKVPKDTTSFEVKLPRDSSPGKSNLNPAPIGFEKLESIKKRFPSGSCIDVISTEHNVKVASNTPGPIGFVLNEDHHEVELREPKKEGIVSTSEFRKSLEDALRHQPQTHPRHLLKSTNETLPSEISFETKTPIHLPSFPIPAQRPSKEQTEKSDPLTRYDKPLIPEKPTVVNRSVISVDYSKPLVPEKPVVALNKPYNTNVTSGDLLVTGIGAEPEIQEIQSSHDSIPSLKEQAFNDSDNSATKEKPYKPPKPTKPVTITQKLLQDKDCLTKAQSDSCSSDEDKLDEKALPTASCSLNSDATHL